MRQDPFAARIAAAYFSLALVWILFSDSAVGAISSDPAILTTFQSAKGAAFVIATTAGLYLLVSRKLRQLETARQTLARSADDNDLLMNYAADGLVIANTSSIIVRVNQSIVELTGYSAEELIGSDSSLFIVDEDPAIKAQRYQQMIENRGQVIEIQRRVRRKDGRFLMTEWRSKLLPNGLIQGMVRDITERVDAEAALHRHAARLQLLTEITGAFTEASDDYVGLAQTVVRRAAETIGDGCLLCLANEAGDRVMPIVSYSIDPQQDAAIREVAGRTYVTPGKGPAGQVYSTGRALLVADKFDQFMSTVHPEWVLFFQAFPPQSMLYIPMRARGSRIGVLILLHSNPQRAVYTEDDLNLAQDMADRAALAISNAQLLQSVQHELAERIDAERALEQSEGRFRIVADTFPMFIWMLDERGGLSYINKAWTTYTGLPVEAAQGVGWGAAMHPDDRAEMAGQVAEFARDREPFSIDFQLRRHDGEYRWMLSTGMPRFTSAGEFAGFVGSSIDLTERREAETAMQALNDDLERRVAERTAELTTANEQLRELDEMRSKFVAHVTHDLRNPVASLSMRLYIMARSPERYAEHVEVLTEQVDRLKHLINSVLDLSRIDLGRSSVQFEPIHFNTLVEGEVLALTTHAEDVGLKLVCQLNPTETTVWGVPNQIAQVVANLVGNAIHYTPSGLVEVTTAFDEAEQMSVLRVRDTGLGIASEDLPHLFERFYRGRTVTEQDLPGSGLGLSIVKEVVDIHHGHLEVESEVGKGTTFLVWLPVAPVTVQLNS